MNKNAIVVVPLESSDDEELELIVNSVYLEDDTIIGHPVVNNNIADSDNIHGEINEDDEVVWRPKRKRLVNSIDSSLESNNYNKWTTPETVMECSAILVKGKYQNFITNK